MIEILIEGGQVSQRDHPLSLSLTPYSASKTPAAPIPVPMHMETTP